MSNVLAIGGSQTGGTNKTLTGASMSGGVAAYVTQDHTVLKQQKLTVSIGTPKNTSKELGTAETRFVISFVNTGDGGEGCCNSVVGGVMADLKLRWNLNQPESEVDLLLDYLQGLAFSTQLRDALVKGIYPA